MTIGRRLVRRIERMRLAVPMALAMAGATAFLAWAVPAAIIERAVTLAGIDSLTTAALPFGDAARAVLAAAVALLSGGAVWALFAGLERPARPKPAAADPDIDLFAPEPVSAPPRMANPDVPVRRPLFAASDLGAPMDDVDGGATPFGRPPLFRDENELELEPEPQPQPVDEDGGADDTLLLETRYEPDPIAQNAPDAQFDSSISGMMARLERGLDRRGGADAVPPADPESLRRALADLQALTRKS